jgi:hypothetical protein
MFKNISHKTMTLQSRFFLIILACSLLFGGYACRVHQQQPTIITEDDWDNMIEYLSASDWEKAEQETLRHLKRFSKSEENSEDAAIIRYMYIRCVGAQLATDKDKSAADKKVKNLVNKPIITPVLTYKTKGLFNYFSLNEAKDAIFLCAANDEATNIFCFETYQMKDKRIIENITDYEGEDMRIKGVIKSISAGGFALPRLDILVIDSELMED